MTVTEHVWHALGSPRIEGEKPATGLCCLCGRDAGEWDRDRFVKQGFTNHDRLLARTSNAVCTPCAVCLDTAKLRMSSWIAFPDRIVWLKREDIWDVLFGGFEPPPFAAYVTTSWKKHGSFKTRVNHSWREFYVQFEELGVTFESTKWWQAGATMQLLYSVPVSEQAKAQPRSNFTKEQILTGDYPSRRAKDFGLARLLACEDILGPLRGHPAFALLIFALNQTPEEDAGNEK